MFARRAVRRRFLVDHFLNLQQISQIGPSIQTVFLPMPLTLSLRKMICFYSSDLIFSYERKRSPTFVKRNIFHEIDQSLSEFLGKIFDGPRSILHPQTCVLFRNGRRTHVSYRFNSVTARTRVIC